MTPPPTYLFNEDTSSPSLSEDFIFARSHSSRIPTNFDLHSAGEQPLAESTPVSSEARIPAFPDHEFQPTPSLLCLPISSNASSTQLTPKPTNSVSRFCQPQKRAFSLSRFRASIKETFAVNPFLDIPVHLLSPLPPGETTRKNLLLMVEDGGIDVNVHLIGEPTPNAPTAVGRTELHLELCGSVENTFPLIVKIVSLPHPVLRLLYLK
jgi:hypothetical protein